MQVLTKSAEDVAPSRVRGLKRYVFTISITVRSRTLTGAWIETGWGLESTVQNMVAPSRVRGLKQVLPRQRRRG